MMGLNFQYFSGQTFDLNQKVMNKMIADVHTLIAEVTNLKVSLGQCASIGGWMSAAMEDPKVCDEMKRDIKTYFEGIGPVIDVILKSQPPTDTLRDRCTLCGSADGKSMVLK
jgi:hypothetical protein